SGEGNRAEARSSRRPLAVWTGPAESWQVGRSQPRDSGRAKDQSIRFRGQYGKRHDGERRWEIRGGAEVFSPRVTGATRGTRSAVSDRLDSPHAGEGRPGAAGIGAVGQSLSRLRRSAR